MDQSKVTVRYAKAFFGLAKEKQLLDEVKNDMEMIGQLIKTSTDLQLLLESPVVKSSKKVSLLKTIFEGKVNQLTVDFLAMVAANKREIFTQGICLNFAALYRQDQGIKSAVITTAVPLQEDLVSQIQKQLESEFKTKVELSQRVDTELIGGFVLRVDDRQIDASMASKLRRVKETYLQTQINK